MRRLLTPGWLAGHALVVLMVAAFGGLGWWQAGRAADGNTLSWAYTFEWPLFAIFVIVLWVREMRQTLRQGPATPEDDGQQIDQPDTAGQPDTAAQERIGARPVITRRVRHATSEPDDDSDPQLAEYNRYLAWLNEHPEAKPSDYPAKEFR